MNLDFKLSKRGYCIITILVIVFCRVRAQQWVWSEISKENDGDSGGLFGGILGTIILFSIMWLLVTILEDKKKPDTKFPKNVHESPKNVHESEYEKFQHKCISIYGEYAELSYGLIFIKEDGEYRQITRQDNRYNVLTTYILRNHKERNGDVCIIGDYDILIDYIKYDCNDFDVFPAAKPMDMHGKLEKEFYGERIVMMKAYYWHKQVPFRPNSNRTSLLDYCLFLGWDLCIYIHKYIGQRMDLDIYLDLKNMKLRKMTKDEYLEYKRKAIHLTETSEGCFDGLGNRIGDNYIEANEEMNKRVGYAYTQAFEEREQIDWNLKPGETLQEMKLATDKLLTAKSDS